MLAKQVQLDRAEQERANEASMYAYQEMVRLEEIEEEQIPIFGRQKRPAYKYH